ncbi:putative minor capsid protein [Eel River basin pequenovirus]|nr:putative minor capsid protein [Eel River basin pequenovirus]
MSIQFDPNAPARPAGRRVVKNFTRPSRTKQASRDECDINNIMRKFEKTGLIEHQNRYQGDYGDFSDAMPYHEAMNVVLAADEMFMQLPASIRKQFGHDPQAFLTFASDEKNLDKMREMGLAKPKQRVIEAADPEKNEARSPEAPKEPEGASSSPPKVEKVAPA